MRCNHMRYRGIEDWTLYTDSDLLASSDPGELADHRSKIRAEVISSEEVYVRQLQLFFNCFVNPLTQSKDDNQVTKRHEKWDEYFHNLRRIKQFHQTVMVKALQSNQDGGEGKSNDIGKAILDVGASLKSLYHPYLADFSNLQRNIKRQSRKEKYIQFFKDASRKSGKGLPVDAYIILPIQRLPRYRLLLTNLIQVTPIDHPEFENLEKANELIADILKHLNENEEIRT